MQPWYAIDLCLILLSIKSSKVLKKKIAQVNVFVWYRLKMFREIKSDAVCVYFELNVIVLITFLFNCQWF